MKVIAFNGSPHDNGVTARGISIIKGELEKEGISVELIHVGDKNIHGCIACRKCSIAAPEARCCAIEGDLVNECLPKLKSADGIILGSPVYYGGIAGNFKCFLDRLFFAGADTKYKVGATVVALRRTGGIAAFQQLNNYLNLGGMIITPGVYWEVIHGTSWDELEKDEEGIQIMETQGRNMAWLIKALNAGVKEIPPPEWPIRRRTNFVRVDGK